MFIEFQWRPPARRLKISSEATQASRIAERLLNVTFRFKRIYGFSYLFRCRLLPYKWRIDWLINVRCKQRVVLLQYP